MSSQARRRARPDRIDKLVATTDGPHPVGFLRRSCAALAPPHTPAAPRPPASSPPAPPDAPRPPLGTMGSLIRNDWAHVCAAIGERFGAEWLEEKEPVPTTSPRRWRGTSRTRGKAVQPRDRRPAPSSARAAPPLRLRHQATPVPLARRAPSPRPPPSPRAPRAPPSRLPRPFVPPRKPPTLLTAA